MQVIVMGAAEGFRANGEAPGVEGLDSLYPGKQGTHTPNAPDLTVLDQGVTLFYCRWHTSTCTSHPLPRQQSSSFFDVSTVHTRTHHPP